MHLKELEQLSPGSYYYDVRDQLKRHIHARAEEAFRLGDEVRDRIVTIEELQEHNERMRSHFLQSIGGLPESESPLNPLVTGVIQEDGFRIEKLIFESRPKTFVTANLYIPDGIESPRGAVLFLCGHSEQAKQYPEYQIVCRYLVKTGLVVLAQDPIGQGERFSYYEPSLRASTVTWGVWEHDYAGTQSLLLGDSIVRYFIHDAMRGIDYLVSRPEVDPSKIGVTGNSGGGTQTALMMVCDPRIAAAAPATFIMNRQCYLQSGGAQDAEQIWPGMAAHGFDHEDILLAMAPRPVRVLAVTSDFFPIEGTRRTVDRCKRFWELYGRDDCLDLFEDDSRHCYTRPMAKAAAEFFSQHLIGELISPGDSEVEPIEPGRLNCTETRQVRADYADSRAVYDENNDRLMEISRQRKSIDPKLSLEWLRDRIFADRKPCPLNPRYYQTGQIDELSATAYFWWAQEGIFNHGILIRNFSFQDQELPVTIALWDEGTDCLQPHISWIRGICNAGRAVMVLDVSGVGGIKPNPGNDNDPLDFYGVNYNFAHELMWLGDSLSALRTYDVIRSLDLIGALSGLNPKDIHVLGHGKSGVYGVLASLLDDRIGSIRWDDGFGSYADLAGSRYYDRHNVMSIIIPGILRYLDIHKSNEMLSP